MKARNGFTLIELLVVIAIIALLSSVVLASLSTARMKARDARRIADFEQIKIALEFYYDAKGYYPGVVAAGGFPACSGVTPSWDCNGYMRSYITGAVGGSWDTLATELSPYIAKLPVDPINSPACTPWAPGPPCYTYAYGNVGRTSYRATYDLVARLETPNHPSDCTNVPSYYGAGYGTTTNPWCAILPDLYDPSPN